MCKGPCNELCAADWSHAHEGPSFFESTLMAPSDSPLGSASLNAP